METRFLADYPEYVDLVASWLHGEWGHYQPTSSVETTARIIRSHTLNRDQVPMTIIALDSGVAVGTAALRNRDMIDRPELEPWLSSVYVAPEHRNRGVGSLVVAAVESIACSLGIERLYLFTPDRQGFYRRLGWSILENREYRNQTVSIMVKRLTGSSV